MRVQGAKGTEIRRPKSLTGAPAPVETHSKPVDAMERVRAPTPPPHGSSASAGAAASITNWVALLFTGFAPKTATGEPPSPERPGNGLSGLSMGLSQIGSTVSNAISGFRKWLGF